MERPNFSSTMSTQSFNSFYWYKKELEQICRTHGLPSYGTKAELESYVNQFLDGVPTSKIKSIRKIRRNTSNKLTSDQITLDTKLLNSGFSLNNEARVFFSNYFNLEKFSFSKPMAIMMREVEKNADTEATVSDLIASLSYKKISYTDDSEEKTYQWNNFVRDFRKDPNNSIFSSQMKVASILWKEVKNSNKEKVYNQELVRENYDLIKEYLK